MTYLIRWIMMGMLGGLLALPAARAAATITLATEGSTRYVICLPDNPSAVDSYAAETLAGYLEQMSGAAFPTGQASELGDGQAAIFIGLSEVALQRLGEVEPLDEQEHVARTVGQDLFLYGEGLHGNLHATINFLEDSLGWRWFSLHEDPVVPSLPTIELEPFHRSRTFTFSYRRASLAFDIDYFYQHGYNLGFEAKDFGDAYVADLPFTAWVHTAQGYIPSLPTSKYADRFEWQDRKNYFETHPEWFSLNEFGERVANKQLCFSNADLRREFTRNVIRDIEHHRTTKGWERLAVTVDAADTGDLFCYCDDCKGLEAHYQTPAGPLVDYLIELCGVLAEQYPQVMVKTLAYRRAQTQQPPVLPPGEMLPENLIIDFAAIEDAYHADWWNHRQPDIQETYRHLLGWGKVTHNLWAWIYPNPWGTGAFVPIGNIERMVATVRLMRYAGVDGLFADHNGRNHRNSFYELQAYLLIKLMQDVNCDVDAVVAEFTDHHYGDAGALMRRYIEELEEGRKEMAALPEVSYNSALFNLRTFPWLTVDNIHRWQGYFDRMQSITAAQPDAFENVRFVRRKLDFATLWRWHDLAAAHPDYFQDYTLVADRIRSANELVTQERFVRALGTSLVEDFVLKIKAGGKEPPLPDQLADVDPERVRQFVPRAGRATGDMAEDPQAAFGYAAPVHLPDMPFNFGFYQNDIATRDEAALRELPADSKSQWRRALNRRFTQQRELTAGEITPGTYQLFELGEVQITPKCMIWFSAQSWATAVDLGRLYEPGAENRWMAYASMKFEGPSYGGEEEEDRVLVDRVIMVPLSKDQFAAPE